KRNINIINKEEAPEDMINAIPEGFKENMINLVNQYDKLQEIINWFNTKDDIDNTNVIEVNTGIRIDLPDAPIKRTTIRDKDKINIINKEEDTEDMINAIPEGFKENMINLVNQYDKLQEIINWFNTKDDIDNTNVIEVNTGIRIDLPDAPIKRTTIRVNDKV